MEDGGIGVWGLRVRVLHFSQFRDEKSAFFQLEVRGLPKFFTILLRFPPKFLNFGVFGLSREVAEATLKSATDEKQKKLRICGGLTHPKISKFRGEPLTKL